MLSVNCFAGLPDSNSGKTRNQAGSTWVVPNSENLFLNSTASIPILSSSIFSGSSKISGNTSWVPATGCVAGQRQQLVVVEVCSLRSDLTGFAKHVMIGRSSPFVVRTVSIRMPAKLTSPTGCVQQWSQLHCRPHRHHPQSSLPLRIRRFRLDSKTTLQPFAQLRSCLVMSQGRVAPAAKLTATITIR